MCQVIIVSEYSVKRESDPERVDRSIAAKERRRDLYCGHIGWAWIIKITKEANEIKPIALIIKNIIIKYTINNIQIKKLAWALNKQI